MEVKRVRVTNCKQFQFLVARMESNPSVAKGEKFCEASHISRERYNDIWRDVTTGLNSLGPPTRSVSEWQKVWTDYKLRIKRKLTQNKREIEGTGGGPNQIRVLSSTEEAVVNLLSLDQTVNNPGSVFGLLRRAPESPILHIKENLSEDEAEPDNLENAAGSSSRYNFRSNRKRHTEAKTDLRYDLLRKQTEYMKQIAEYSGECARYARKTYELKEDVAKEKRNYVLRKEKHRTAELEYKKQLLQYKQKKLALLERQAKQEDH